MTFNSNKNVRKDKANLQKWIWQYEKRGINKANNPQYLKWKSKLSKIEVQQRQIKLIAKIVENFTGDKPNKEGESIAKKLMCKWCLENGIKVSYINWYMNWNSYAVNTAYNIRKRFTSSFKNAENKIVWQRFKQYIDRKLSNNKTK
jgi:hypothetical protein